MPITADDIVANLRRQGCEVYLNRRGQPVIRHRPEALSEAAKNVIRRFRFRIISLLERENASSQIVMPQPGTVANYTNDELEILKEAGIEPHELDLVDRVKQVFPLAVVIAAHQEPGDSERAVQKRFEEC